jgi:glutathione S-transferase
MSARGYPSPVCQTQRCIIRYAKMADPELLPPGRHPTLDALSARCEALAEFQATWPADYVLPRNL